MHGCALKRMKTLLKQFGQVKLPIQSFKSYMGHSKLDTKVQWVQLNQRIGCNIQVSQFWNYSWVVYLHTYTFFFNIVWILTLESNFIFCVRFQGTTKEAFVVDAMRLALEHCKLFIPHHAAKVITKYLTSMGITFSSSSLVSLEE
jgi:hypothetical protein